MGIAQAQFSPASLALIEATIPAPDMIDFGTVLARVLKFDDTTEEYANGLFEVPPNIDASGTVTFRATVSPATGAASKNVAMTFGHRPPASGEAIDGAYTDEDSGDKSITATTGQQTQIEWTETVANLGWVAKDIVYFRVSRYSAPTNNLSGDMYLLHFSLDIPTSAA